MNFKRVIWHKSFDKILERFRQLDEFGQMFDCGDGVRRWLFPVILLLSADYEEQYVHTRPFCPLVCAYSIFYFEMHNGS